MVHIRACYCISGQVNVEAGHGFGLGLVEIPRALTYFQPRNVLLERLLQRTVLQQSI